MTKHEFKDWLDKFIAYWSGFKTPSSRIYAMVGSAVGFAFFGTSDNIEFDYHSAKSYLETTINLWQNASTDPEETFFTPQVCQDRVDGFKAIYGALFDD